MEVHLMWCFGRRRLDPAKCHRVWVTAPTPPQSANIVVPRGPDCDAFVRTFDSTTGLIRNTPPVLPDELKSCRTSQYHLNDEIVIRKMSEITCLSKEIMDTIVAIKIQTKNLETGKVYLRCSTGVFMTPVYVFTARSPFELEEREAILSINIEKNGVKYTGIIVDFDDIFCQKPRFERLRTAFGSQVWKLPSRTVDFVVLKTNEPLKLSEDTSFLRIPETPNWSMGTVLLSAGFPDKFKEFDVVNSYYWGFLKRIGSQEWDPEKKERVLRNHFWSTFHWSTDPLVCFGVAVGYSKVEYGLYQFSSMSTVAGMAGSPIVSLDHPDELVGISIGGWSGQAGPIFLDVQTPEVKTVLQYCIENSH